ncbi:MAG: hypothetical protein CBE33_02905 [Candidatus Pelagibacter sp. TMED273]|nr:MAG: hypothetical protein CBE33_02905 [Candidatus Pelagibacter sp. TMED273]
MKKYIYQIRKKRDLAFSNFQKSLQNLFLNFNIPDSNNLIIIGKKNNEVINEYKNVTDQRQVYYFEINEEGNNFTAIRNATNLDHISFDISLLTTTELNKNEYLNIEKKVLGSKVVIFSFDNYFKKSFNDFADLNNYFKSNGFQLFSISNKRIYSLNINKDEYNNYDALSLFAIKKINLLKIVDKEGKESFSFRGN